MGSQRIWKKSKSIHNNAKGLIISKWRAIDIDYEEDWEMAELLYTIQKKEGKLNLFKTEQEKFWAGEFGDEYISRNRSVNY